MPKTKFDLSDKITGKKKKYYESLLKARTEILGQMQFHTEEALTGNGAEVEKRGMATHMADIGSDNSRHEMELQLLTEEGSVLELIEEAIDRLENDDDYGHCIDCGKPIQEARLKIKPYAYYCIECKNIREKNNGMNPYVD